MLVYSGTKKDFVYSVENQTIAMEVRNEIERKLGKKTPDSEFRAFQNSLPQMYVILNDTEIPSNAGVAIEYNIPQTSKRVDFIISGYDKKEKPSVVIVELKQWDHITAIPGADALVQTYINHGEHVLVHPSYQAWSYSALIRDYNSSVEDRDIFLSPCAYLHNYKRSTVGTDPLDAPQYETYLVEAPAFSMGEAMKLREFIKKSVRRGDNKEILYLIENGRIRPSKSLQDTVASMLQGNKEFFMIDDQKVVYEYILKSAQKSQRDGKKRTIIVQGGPGTGKSVIAVNLLADLTNRDQFVQYTSKNSAPRTVYCKKLKGKVRKSSVDNMFKSSGAYVDVQENAVDTILADEAHRLNEKSGMFSNLGENQIKEIIHAAKCSVFFIDESQRVTMKDIGSVEEIQKWADEAGSKVKLLELTSQFRCNGSDGYLAWLDDLLEIRDTANYNSLDIQYDFRLFDSPQELVDAIKAKNAENHRSRVVAGYCWEWPKATQSDPGYHDIQIGEFGMSWNLADYTFALDDSSIDQAGCIHTTQGLEFDYVGVIIGDDLRYENGKIITDHTKRARTDQSVKGLKTLMKANPAEGRKREEEIIKNTYRTLMTRGMKGCYVYCTDPALQAYFRKRLGILEPEEVLVEGEADDNLVQIPVFGEIAAGHTRIMEDAVEGYETVDPAALELNPWEMDRYFYLRVSGDSMINAGIEDGQLVLMYRTSSRVKNGDIVACMVGGESATLKRFYKSKDYVMLMPENDSYEPIQVPAADFEMGEARIIAKLWRE